MPTTPQRKMHRVDKDTHRCIVCDDTLLSENGDEPCPECCFPRDVSTRMDERDRALTASLQNSIPPTALQRRNDL